MRLPLWITGESLKDKFYLCKVVGQSVKRLYCAIDYLKKVVMVWGSYKEPKSQDAGALEGVKLNISAFSSSCVPVVRQVTDCIQILK